MSVGVISTQLLHGKTNQGGSRKNEVILINEMNPDWKDLFDML